jgi:hypothetical protein
MSIATIRPLLNNPKLAEPMYTSCKALKKSRDTCTVNVCCCLGRFVLVTLYPSTTLSISFKGIG